MDFYNKPVPDTYLVNRLKPFDIPNENGTSLVKVVAVSTKEASYWIVAYTMLVAIMFAAVTRLAIDLVLAFAPLKDSGNRRVMLVAFYNSPNPGAGAISMAKYAWVAISGSTRSSGDPVRWYETAIELVRKFFESLKRIIRRKASTQTETGARKTVNWACIRFALGLIGVASVLMAADAAASFLVSGGSLVVRHATRANPAHIFYMDFQDAAKKQGLLLDQVKPIRGSANFQALGRFETSREQLKDRVLINTTKLPEHNGEPMVRFEYSYYLTGFEMGLQKAPKLRYDVSGHCETDYEIISQGPPPRDFDIYTYWNSNFTRDAYSPKEEQRIAPFVNMVDGALNRTEADGFPYGWTPHTAFRLTNGEIVGDPWYVTEKNPDYNASNSLYAYGGKYRVKRGRPALLCWQKDTFSLGGRTVNRVDKLSELPGLGLSTLLRESVFPFEFGSPPIIQLGNNLGYDSLASSLYFTPNNQLLSVNKVSIDDDFKKLVSVAFLYSREVVRNLPLLYSTLDGKGLTNLAEVNGQVPSDYADIILESSGVAALNLKVLIATPVACIFAWLLVFLRLRASEALESADSKPGRLSRMHARSVGFPATQLYRCVDEQVSKRGPSWWSNLSSMTPYVKDIDDDNSPTQERAREGVGKPYAMPELSNNRERGECDIVMRSGSSASPRQSSSAGADKEASVRQSSSAGADKELGV